MCGVPSGRPLRLQLQHAGRAGPVLGLSVSDDEGVVVREGLLGVGKLLPLSLSCDHRVIDGGMAATALARIIELLQTPEELVPSR